MKNKLKFIFDNISFFYDLFETIKKEIHSNSYVKLNEFNISLILEEVFVNIFSYSNYVEPIFLKIKFLKNYTRIIIVDDGIEFNPLSYNADIYKPIESMNIGGLGIHIVKKLTSNILYKRYSSKNILFLDLKSI